MGDGIEEVLADRGPSPSEVAQGHELEDLVAWIMSGFTEKSGLIIRLWYLDGVGAAEIASRLGMKKNTVDMHISRARRTLEAELREKYPGLFSQQDSRDTDRHMDLEANDS